MDLISGLKEIVNSERPLTLLFLVGIMVSLYKISDSVHQFSLTIEDMNKISWTMVDEKLQSELEEKVLKRAFQKVGLEFSEEWPDPITTVLRQKSAGARK